MEKYNLESIFGHFLKKLPPKWYMELVVESSKDNDSWAMAYINKRICFDRAYMLAEEKLAFFARAMGQLIVIYLLSFGLLCAGHWICLDAEGTILGGMMAIAPITINITLCYKLLFEFHSIGRFPSCHQFLYAFSLNFT